MATDRLKWFPIEPVVPARRDVALAEIKRQLDAGVNPVVLSPEVGAWFVDAMGGLDKPRRHVLDVGDPPRS